MDKFMKIYLFGDKPSSTNQFYRKMKTTFLLLTCFIFSTLASHVSSQVARVNIALKNAKITQVLDAIESQTDYLFVYNTNEIDLNFDVTINANNETVAKVLSNICPKNGLVFAMVGNNIMLMNRKTTAQQQGKIVTGKVVDVTGAPIPGVTVIIKGTTSGSITDYDGQFSLESVSEEATLQFSFVGMVSVDVPVAGKSRFDIVMKEESLGLDEVVVMGYGVQMRRKVTSSVASVNMNTLESIPTSSVSQALSGKAAGLSVNINSAQPGGAASFQIRGAATRRSPLIVIDGMPTSDFNPSSVGVFGNGSLDATLSTLNPNDIESIDILKDASATAIYGSQGSGGVIMITTKRGKKDEKVSVNLNISSGVQKFYNLPKMLNAVDYMKETNRVMREKWLYDRRQGVYSTISGSASGPEVFMPYYSNETIAQFENGTNVGTDFVDEITRTGAVQDVDLSVSGSSKNTRFYSSFSLYDQKGIIKNNDLSKYNGRINVDQDFGDKLTGGISVTFSQINTNNVPIGNGDMNEKSGILMSALQFDPTLPVRDALGNYQINVRQSNFPNPVSFLDITNETKVERFFNTAHLKYNILPELSVKAQVGFDRTQSRSYGYLPTTTIAGKSYNGRADRADDLNTNYQFQMLVNYMKTFGDKHHFSGLWGTEYMKYLWEGTSITATNFPYDGVKWNNLGLAADRAKINSKGGSTETSSYFSQLNYDFDHKYFISANLRVDGSANFAPDDQYAFFPGISVGWDLSRESFMAGTNHWLDQLKIRAGYGQTGNDSPKGMAVSSAYTDWYDPGADTMWGNSVISGVKLAGLGNPNLKWEKQVDFNVGVDFSLRNGRITGSMEYFNRVITDIVGFKRLNSSFPVNEMLCNLDAKKQTYGTELTLNSININKRDFTWNTLVTFTYYRDRWLKRDPSYVLGINESTRQYENELWYYQSEGLVPVGSNDPLNPIPGTVKIKDVNGYKMDASGKRIVDENGKPLYSGAPDGKIDAADLVKIGVNTPFNIGFNNSFRYKNFDLAIDAYGVFNQWKINSTKTALAGPSVYNIVNIGSNMMDEIKGRWNSDNLNGDGISALQPLAKYGTGDYFLEKAWFIRIRNIALGYTLPKASLQKLKMSNLRIFANVMNPFLFTPYSGMDPETESYVAAYPNQRTYSLGVQIGF